MGNCKSCCYVKHQTATIIDATGNLRKIKAPVTASEIMLDEPGHVVSPALLIRNTCRVSAMKVDEHLSAGAIYLVVPMSRAGSKVSELETALIDSAFEKRRSKRGRFKILPTVSKGSGDNGESPAVILQGNNSTGFLGHRLGSRRTWTPALEPILEATVEHVELNMETRGKISPLGPFLGLVHPRF